MSCSYRQRLCAVAMFSNLAIACGASSNLGRISVRPACAAIDRVCLEEGFDAPIAVGSSLRLELDFWLPGSSPPRVSVESVSEHVAVEGQQLSALSAGVAAIVINGPDDKVYDFIHVWTELADALVIRSRSQTGQVAGDITDNAQLTVGDQLSIRIDARTQGADLIGEVSASFQTDERVARVSADGVAGEYTVNAVAEGSATVTVEALGLTQSFVVEVSPQAAVPTQDSATSASSAGSTSMDASSGSTDGGGQ